MPSPKKEPTKGKGSKEDWSEPTDEGTLIDIGEDDNPDADQPPVFQAPITTTEPKEEPTLAKDDPKPGEPSPEIDAEREASVGEVVANQRIEDTKGDLAPMQPTETTGQKPSEPDQATVQATAKERKFLVAVGRLGTFRYGQEVTQSQMKVSDTDLSRLLREGALSEPNPSK